MNRAAVSAAGVWLAVVCGAGGATAGEDEVIAYVVVSEPPKDKARIAAKVAVEGNVADMPLVASEAILNNPIWKKLEICHAMKLEGHKRPDGFYVSSVRVIDGAMLPMVLQGFAGDCLLKKALDVAPLVD
jgi:hypothetical protein